MAGTDAPRALELLTAELFNDCRGEARRRRVSLDRVVVERGLLGEEELLRACAGAVGCRYYDDLKDYPVSAVFRERVSAAFARRHFVLGLEGEDDRELEIVFAMPWDNQPLDDVARLVGRPVRPGFARRESILARINESFGSSQDLVSEFAGEEAEHVLETASAENLLELGDKAPVVRLVNMILFEALRRRASDVHLQPYADHLQVRLRIDGVLYDTFQVPSDLAAPLVSRIKVMGAMDIAEHLVPQDGRTSVRIGEKLVDLRISTLPGSLGERVVLRLLDKSARLYRLEELGMGPELLRRFERLINLSHGILLVTGPTGSGKSTTLYAALERLNSVEKNILTVEDPIEYQLEGISQTQVATRKGVTFATGLRTILRQDPDVIMVGEVRDAETARMATQSALTGHLVFSTLHTNDSSGAIARLLDLGIEPFLVSSSVLAVLAQRLIRRICPHCRCAVEPDESLLGQIGLAASDLPDGILWRGKGCGECLESGFRDRMAIYEFLVVTETVRAGILTRAGATEIKRGALADGMQSLRRAGAEKVIAGVTTPEEVLRVTQRDEV